MLKRRLSLLCIIWMVLTISGCRRIESGLYDVALDIEHFRAGVETKELVVDDIKFSYLEGGEVSDEVIFLIHGFAAEKDNWVRLAGLLTDHYRVIVPDLPGHGETTSDTELDYGIEFQTERLASLMEAMNIKQVHLAGNSMGGAIALLFARDYPDRLKSLILIDNAGIDSAQPSEFMTMIEKGGNPLIPRQPGDYDKLVDFVMSKPPVMPWPIMDVLEEKALARVDLNEKIFQDILRSQERFEQTGSVEDWLPGIKTPTLIIWGQNDRVLDVSSVDVMTKLMPDARAIILSGIGHVPMLEDPDGVSRAIRYFLK